MTFAPGTRASVRKTSLNEAWPFIWRSGADVDTRLAHGEHEAGDAAMLGHVPVGAREQKPPVGVMRARAPHLLTVEHPLVAVTIGAGREAGEIGAASGLAEQLAPRDLTRERRAQETLLQLVGTVREDCRRREPEADSERRPRPHRPPRSPRARCHRPRAAGRGHTTPSATTGTPIPNRRDGCATRAASAPDPSWPRANCARRCEPAPLRPPLRARGRAPTR